MHGRGEDVTQGETVKFIVLVQKVIESFENSNITFDFPSAGEVGGEYDASIESIKGVFKVTAAYFADSDRSFREAVYNIANHKCDTIIVTKISPTDDLKNKVELYNVSDKEHKIHLISGDTEEKLKKEFTAIL